jgi:DNA invertase Pin-like site-specific DNA recombinase
LRRIERNGKPFQRFGAKGFSYNDLLKAHQKLTGTGNPSAKLDEEKVRAIREKLANGAKQAALANEYNVSKTTIGSIARREIWKHVQ